MLVHVYQFMWGGDFMGYLIRTDVVNPGGVGYGVVPVLSCCSVS